MTVSSRASNVAGTHEVRAWIDTGFNGELVLPKNQIDDLERWPSGTLKANLADGSVVAVQRDTCLIDWFGDERELDVVANDGAYPLLGVGLPIG